MLRLGEEVYKGIQYHDIYIMFSITIFAKSLKVGVFAPSNLPLAMPLDNEC